MSTGLIHPPSASNIDMMISPGRRFAFYLRLMNLDITMSPMQALYFSSAAFLALAPRAFRSGSGLGWR